MGAGGRSPGAAVVSTATTRLFYYGVRFELALLLQKAVHNAPHFFQGSLQFAERRRRPGKLFVAELVQRSERPQAAIQAFLLVGIKGLGGFTKRPVENLRRQFAFFQSLFPGGFLLLGLGLLLGSDVARIFVLVEVVAIAA